MSPGCSRIQQGKNPYKAQQQQEDQTKVHKPCLKTKTKKDHFMHMTTSKVSRKLVRVGAADFTST